MWCKKDILDKDGAVSTDTKISVCVFSNYNHFGVSMTPIWIIE